MKSHWGTALVLLTLSAVCASVNLTKAVHIDDTAYLEIAQAILQDPLHPMSGTVNWDNTADPISHINQPHLLFYVQALVMRLSCESELALHGLMAVATSLSILVFYRLAKHLVPRQALFATALFFLGPVFLPAQNLMTDVPFLALWLTFFWALLRASGTPSGRWYLVCALASAAACLVKYTSLVLLPILAAVAIRRHHWRALGFLGVPIAALVGWSLFNTLDYSGVHLLERRIVDQLAAEAIAWKTVDWVAGLGSVAPFSILFLSRATLRRLGVRLLAGITIASTVILLLAWHHPNATPQTSLLWAAFFGNGLFTLALASHAVASRAAVDGSQRLLLGLWAVGACAFAILFAPIMAIRHVLLAMPPLLFLLVKATERPAPRRRKALALAATVLLGMGLAVSDYGFANVYREQASRIKEALPADARIWYAGHWGWQWYARKAGMRQFDTYETEFSEGDYFVVPSLVHRQVIPQHHWQSLQKVATISVPSGPSTWVHTMAETPLGGVYAYSFQRFHGPPWQLSTAPLDTISIYVAIEPPQDAASGHRRPETRLGSVTCVKRAPEPVRD